MTVEQERVCDLPNNIIRIAMNANNNIQFVIQVVVPVVQESCLACSNES